MEKKTISLLFTDTQQRELKKLKLLPEQIAELETALPLNRELLEPVAPMTDVREELRDLHRAIKKAQEAVLNISKGKSDARKEARTRLVVAANHVAGMALPHFIKSLETPEEITEIVPRARDGDPHAWLEMLRKITEIALEDLPNQQRRKWADFRPVARIEEALLNGFIKAHKQPPYTLRTSSSPDSKFRRIVNICYQAMGQEHDDPERAIKAYLQAKKRRSQQQRERIVRGATTHTGWRIVRGRRVRFSTKQLRKKLRKDYSEARLIGTPEGEKI